ncbi:MAG: RecX family transcriptional regulator [Candidatus Eremiobacteraeota bacterium]|nr:RecX family transcriptional regulator [Candidatus Eremiobacteraeota bacterium]
MPSARAAALRLLARRRLTEAQLRSRLEREGFDDAAIGDAVTACRCDGWVDDALFATLYVEGRRAAVGDARLVAELVKRGVDRSAARERVAAVPTTEAERVEIAYAKLRAAHPSLSYQSAARRLERLGFPAALIYRVLRARAGADLGEVLGEPI